MKTLISYMLRGLLLLAPVVVTLYIIYAMFKVLDDSVNDFLENIFGIRVTGLGVIVLLGVITVIGFLSSTLVFRPLFIMLEHAIARAPLVNIIYTSLKDFVAAFFSDKKKFNQPVVVNVNGNPEFQKLGFITKTDLSSIGLKGKVAVYLPHSYNFSGNLFVVDAKNVTPLDVPVAEFMKFIVSGGITEWDATASTLKK
ncbi:MAG: DUF502 domain-containing protein [Chitinophagales bacterium]|nr:DUF502 domain-containing protein [Chitinophagales bacterium]